MKYYLNIFVVLVLGGGIMLSAQDNNMLSAQDNNMLSAQDNNDTNTLSVYFDNPILAVNYAELDAKVDNTKPMDIALKKFRDCLANSADADLILDALEYWINLYNSGKAEYHNFLHWAYIGTIEAMLGGAINGVLKKTEYAGDGMKKLAEAVEEAESSSDNFAKGYAYFLQSQTFSNMPTFFKEFKKQTIPSLKTTESLFKKAEKQKLYDNVLISDLLGRVEEIYGFYYFKIKDYKKAKNYYENVTKANVNNDLKQAAREKLAEIEKKL